MKIKNIHCLLCAYAALTLCAANWVQAQLNSALTYQGRLENNAAPANGAYDLTFQVFTNSVEGLPLSEVVTNTGVVVKDGIFTTLISFKGQPVDRRDYWLEVGVRPMGGGDFTRLTPRQPLTSTPFAWYADLAATANTATLASNVAPGSVTAMSLAGDSIKATNITSGQVVKSLNGLTDTVTLSAGANVSLAVDGNGLKISAVPGTVVTNAGWGLSGNPGTTSSNFLGTTDGQPLEFRVNKARALRLEPNTSGAPNVVAGASVNRVGPGIVGATIAGGGASSYQGGAYTNRVDDNFGTIGGGVANFIQLGAYESVIGGGYFHTIESGAYESTIGGGYRNTVKANARDATIGGGSGHTIAAIEATIGGGFQNSIEATNDDSTISGGYQNTIRSGSKLSTIGGGWVNRIGTNAFYSTISGGHGGSVGTGSSQSTIAGGYWHSIGVNAWSATIAGGYHNVIGDDATQAAITGGANNAVNAGAYGAIIAGGDDNLIQSGAYDSVVAGGSGNQIGSGAYVATLSGGVNNRVNGAGATVPGGNGNEALGINSYAAGTQAHALHEGAFVWADAHYADFSSTAQNQFLIRAPKVGINTNAPQATLHVVPPASYVAAAQFDGEVKVKVLTITGGADMVEPFKMSGQNISRGSVVIIDEENPGQLKLSQCAYDSRVAGIVSGANGIQPGLSLSQQGALEGGQQVALSGRVYVRADASQGAIKPGDLLTTSAIPGHAMKATDHLRAQGAILGKAMSGLKQGQGLVLVLVTLQ